MSRLRGDYDAGSAGRDDGAKFFQHESRAIKINFQDRGRRCLRGGDASGMDDAGDGANRGGFLDQRVDRFARGNVNGRSAHIEPCVAKNFRGCICVWLA